MAKKYKTKKPAQVKNALATSEATTAVPPFCLMRQEQRAAVPGSSGEPAPGISNNSAPTWEGVSSLLATPL